MKKRRRRLRPWVKGTMLTVIVGLVLGFVLVKGLEGLNNMYEECDNAKDYTCSYYEARLYSIKGE